MGIDVRPIIISLRPLQWLKNLAVFAAVLFAGDLFNPQFFWPVFAAFWLFNIISSAMYLVNDVIDVEHDQVHIYKRLRPIAKGVVKKKIALGTAALLLVVGLYLAYLLSIHFFVIALIFVVLQFAYNLFLKYVILLDVITIAIAFMLRIFAGSLVVLASLSSWLILTTMMLALLLAIGKRRSELTLLTKEIAGKHRETLYRYPTKLLDGFTFIMASATLITYSLFTFNEIELQSKEFIVSYLPQTLASPKWLMVTIPLVVYGIFRYLYLIFEGTGEDSPEKILVKDLPLLITTLLWILSVIIIIYALPSG